MDGSKDRRDRRFISRMWSTHLAAALMVVLAAPSSFAIDVVIDYSFDTNNFFGAGNPNGAAAGAQARASLDEAALFFSNILDDTFDEIMVPADFQSAVFNGNVTYSFNRVFDDPATGNGVTLPTTNVPENEFRVFAGARSLGGTTLGVGGPGGAGLASDSQGGFTQSEIDQLNATTDAFFDNVQTRGETSGFVGWGGAISFDTVTNWHFDAATDPSTGESDFFSVAIHEVAHTFGWGTSSEWDALVSGGVFVGAASTAYRAGNLDDDAAVDSTDLGLLINNFGFASASSFAVPEPSGLGMLLMLSLLGAGTFRKFA